MPIPKLIPIKREENYYTHYIGKFNGDMQFMGFVVATLLSLDDDWKSKKRWYSILYQFDCDGNHVGTKYKFFGTTADGEREVTSKAESQLEDWIKDLENVSFEDIAIKLFELKIDGEVFGLVDASEPDEGYESVNLVPNDLAFFEPWDGEYDT